MSELSVENANKIQETVVSLDTAIKKLRELIIIEYLERRKMDQIVEILSVEIAKLKLMK